MDAEAPGKTPNVWRTVGLVALVGLFELAFASLGIYADYYYTKPIWVWLLLALFAAGAIAALVFAILWAKRKWLAVFAVVGVTLVALVVAGVLSFVMPSPIEARLHQIGRAAGYALMLPQSEKLEAKDQWGYAPSTALENGTFAAHYRRFDVQERKAMGELTAAQLKRSYLADQSAPPAENKIVTDTEKELTILGKPAWAMAWHEEMPGKRGGSGTVIVFQPGGAVVRVTSDDTDGNGLSLDELQTLAKGFAPVQ
jgi:hypothetical protein